MTESDTDDLRAHINREVAASLIWQDDVLSQEQARNLSYYFGNPLGDEAEGRSQLVSWDVFRYPWVRSFAGIRNSIPKKRPLYSVITVCEAGSRLSF
jgi:hypothetical protein